MCKKNINRAAVHLQLSGTRIALDKIWEKIESGNYVDDESEIPLSIDFGVVLDKICLAWHLKYMTDEEIDNLPTEEYIRLSNCIPNFWFDRTLMSGIESEKT